jgi:hypothetical protein
MVSSDSSQGWARLVALVKGFTGITIGREVLIVLDAYRV